jgi:vacuolar-type H+-ATPase subunit H
MEAFSIASAAVSIILGAFAIWLSIVFYRMSVDSSNRIQESSKDLSSTVNKLEKLFEHLYSDTFSMMRDTYSDMRKYVWPEATGQESEIIDQIETRTDNKVSNIRRELLQQIDTIAAQVGGADMKVNQLRTELSPLVEEAISRSRHAEAEAREETLRDVILRQLRSADPSEIKAMNLYDSIQRKNAGWTVGDFLSELRSLKDEGIVNFDYIPGGREIMGGEPIIYVQRASQTINRNRKKTPEA